MGYHSYTISQDGTARRRGPCSRPSASRRGPAEADHRRRQHLDRNHALQLQPARTGRKVKRHSRAAHADGVQYHRISDGVTWDEGMKASLVSREVIADSIELVARGHMFDGLVRCGCDKTIPARRWRC